MWEKLGTIAVVGLGMPSGVYMLNSLIEWKFTNHSTFNPHNHTFTTSTTGVYGNKRICLHLEHTNLANHQPISDDLERIIRHPMVGKFVWKIKCRPDYICLSNVK